MLEIRRNRNRTLDYSVVHEIHNEIEIDVLGISGFSVDLKKLKATGGLASPDKMKAVIAIFSEGEFCASTGLSNSLRKVSKQKSKVSPKEKGLGEYAALWSKQSRAAKVKFDVGEVDANSHQEPFEVWVALTDGKGQNKTCVSYPVGYGALPFDTVAESNKVMLLDLPVVGIPTQDDGNVAAKAMGPVGDDDEDNLQRTQAAVGSAYCFKDGEDAKIRLKVQCKQRKIRKEQKKMSSIISSISKFRQDVPQMSGESDPMLDEEGSKRFRPIETSSLRSPSAFTLGEVGASRLPSQTAAPHEEPNSSFQFKADFGSGFPNMPTGPALSGPQSAFKPHPNASSSFALLSKSNPNIKAPIAMKPTTPRTISTASMTKTPSSGEQVNELPVNMGILHPETEEPSELGESRARNRRMRRAKKNAMDHSKGGLLYEAADAHPLNQDSPGRKSLRVPVEIQTNVKPSTAKERDGGDNHSVASVGTAVSVRNGPFDVSCGAFGTLQVFPNGVLWHFNKGQKRSAAAPAYDDDMSLSTIRTRASSQQVVVPWKESVHAYASETGTVSGREKVDPGNGVGTILDSIFRQLGWGGRT
mmetsp:Transcript_23268/g.64716  ORF Transcript_23268/g.64716 Transcript_23268/m.64716 type:complete len:586 (-) Transcript_23268:23-1780(-)